MYHEKALLSTHDCKGSQEKVGYGLQRSIKCTQSERVLKYSSSAESRAAIGARLANYTVSLISLNQQSDHLDDDSVELSFLKARLLTDGNNDPMLQQLEEHLCQSGLSTQQNCSSVHRLLSCFCRRKSELKECVDQSYKLEQLADRYLNHWGAFHLNRLWDDFGHWKQLMEKLVGLYQLFDRYKLSESVILPSLPISSVAGDQVGLLNLERCCQLAKSWPGQNWPETLYAVKNALSTLNLQIVDIEVCFSLDDKVKLRLLIERNDEKQKELFITLSGHPENQERQQFLREICILFGAECMVEYWRQEGADYDLSPLIQQILDDEGIGYSIKLSFGVSGTKSNSLFFVMDIGNPEALYYMDDDFPDVKAENWLQCLDQLYTDISNLPTMMAKL